MKKSTVRCKLSATFVLVIRSTYWINEIIEPLQTIGVEVIFIAGNEYRLNNLLVCFLSGSEKCMNDSLEVILIHEDYFHGRKNQLLMRLKSQLGINKYRIHGRATTPVILKRNVAEKFVNDNHLLGFTGGKTFLGLFHADELVSVAVFSAIRFMKYENPVYYSSELVRFCSLADTTVVGGLDKLIQFYLKNYQTDDIVTTVDLEWSRGRSFQKLGFKKVATTDPLLFAIDAITFQRRVILSLADLLPSEYPVTNKGNLKLQLLKASK